MNRSGDADEEVRRGASALLDAGAAALAVTALATWPFVAWEVRAFGLAAPVSDVAALGLIGMAGAGALLAGGTLPRPPAAAAATAFFGVMGLSALLAPEPGPAAHEWVRKGVFSYVAHGVALAWAVSRLPATTARRLVGSVCGGLVLLAIATSAHRIAGGAALDVRGIAGLVTNHKALAVALAPATPLAVWAWRAEEDPRLRRLLGAAALALPVALALSFSKTSLIVGAVALAMTVSRAEGARRLLLVGALALPLSALSLGVGLTGGTPFADATQARHSLDLRAWELFRSRPLLGHGAGASVRHVATEWPHVRVNGVEAHGVVQKVAAEEGALGLLVYGVMVLGLLGALSCAPRAVVDTGILLHLALLLSTEAFTASHWAPLGACLGIAAACRRLSTPSGEVAPPSLAPRPARLGLLAGAAATVLGAGWSSLRPGAAPSDAAVREAVARFEAALVDGDGARLARAVSRAGVVLPGAAGPVLAADLADRAGRDGPGGFLPPAPSAGPRPTGLAPAGCLWDWDGRTAAVACALAWEFPLDHPGGAGFTPPRPELGGVYLLTRESLGLRVAAAARPGLQ